MSSTNSFFRFLLIRPYRKSWRTINKLGKRKKCYICHQTFNNFAKYRGGFKNVPLWRTKFNTVGSDIDNYRCYYCGCNDRERHLFMYFDKIGFWSRIKDAEVLHFAPEKNLSAKIEEYIPSTYVKADLNPSNKTIQKIDITNIPFNENTFDILICNHVLEHVPDYTKALNEVFRVLKKNGIAILQTPYSKLLQKNFEDSGINTEELRKLYYGQEDHVRYFSENHFLKSLANAGFKLEILQHDSIFENNLARFYGVNDKEDLIRVLKPGN